MMKTTIETSRKKGSKLGAILRVTSGNFLEQFDFFLFGFYATYISRTFFPATSEFASLMMTFAVFGSGFLMRPLGAIILGAYIDKVGRRKGLIVTLSIMAAGTVLIALVPGYASIGIAAPVLAVEASHNQMAQWWQNRFTLAEYHERLTAVPSVQLAVVDDAGHMLHHDQPEQVAKLIQSFTA